MVPRPRVYALPNNLTFDRDSGRYRWVNPLTKERTWFGRDREKAVTRAEQANLAIRLMQAQREIARGASPTVAQVIDLYTENVVPSRPWGDRTRKHRLIALALYRREFGRRLFAGVDRIYLADWLAARCERADAYNHHRTLLVDLWDYAISRRFAEINEAAATLKRSTSAKIAVNRKTRKRLTTEAFWQIHAAANSFLQTAMELSLITLQARAEVCKARRTDVRDGWLYVIRDKVAGDSDMAFIRIAVSAELERIIDAAYADGILSPFLVHRRPNSMRPQHQQNKPHWSAVTPDYLTKSFARAGDAVGLYTDLAPGERPTFHEIRSLGARIYRKLGYSDDYIRALMTHADKRTTEIYLTNPDALTDRHFLPVKAELRLRELPKI